MGSFLDTFKRPQFYYGLAKLLLAVNIEKTTRDSFLLASYFTISGFSDLTVSVGEGYIDFVGFPLITGLLELRSSQYFLKRKMNPNLPVEIGLAYELSKPKQNKKSIENYI